jgi:hypothetical protein
MDMITRHRKDERKRIVNDERRDGSEEELFAQMRCFK